MQRVDILVLTKAVTYDEWPKMKRDTRQKSSLFLRKRTAFLSGISSFSAIRHSLRLSASPNQSLTIYLFVEWGPLKVLDNTELILNESQFGII